MLPAFGNRVIRFNKIYSVISAEKFVFGGYPSTLRITVFIINDFL